MALAEFGYGRAKFMFLHRIDHGIAKYGKQLGRGRNTRLKQDTEIETWPSKKISSQPANIPRDPHYCFHPKEVRKIENYKNALRL